MIGSAFRLKAAKQKAEALLRDERLADLPVDVVRLAQSREITVQSKPNAVAGASGMLLRHGDSFGILYATHIRSEGFQRFSIAHELGHFFLDGHVDHILPGDGSHVSQAGFTSSDPYELEADHFAAALLMPSGPFKKAVGRHAPGLPAVEALANLCVTSLTATAIRYAELTHDAVAVIVSAGAQIEYCFFSEELKEIKDLRWPKKATRLPRGTLTDNFNSSPERVTRGGKDEAEVDLLDWFGGRRSYMFCEQVIGLGEYGKTLTVLSCEDIETQESEDEDSSSRMPTFR